MKTLAKSGESPFFSRHDGKNPIFRYIYELLNDAIRGATKKDAVTAILSDLTVKNITIWNKRRLFILLLFSNSLYSFACLFFYEILGYAH